MKYKLIKPLSILLIAILVVGLPLTPQANAWDINVGDCFIGTGGFEGWNGTRLYFGCYEEGGQAFDYWARCDFGEGTGFWGFDCGTTS